jgi:hypothetical protein
MLHHDKNQCAKATGDLSGLVSKTAKLRPTLKDSSTQELAMNVQSRLLELSKFQAQGTLQDEIAEKFCSFQIREEGTRLNAATQNAIGNALAQLLDTSHGDDDDVLQLTINEVFVICRDK